MFGDYGQPGGVSIQTVGAAEDKWLSLILVIPHKGVCQRIAVVVKGRVDRHSGRLVYHENVFVFVNNAERKLHWRDIG